MRHTTKTRRFISATVLLFSFSMTFYQANAQTHPNLINNPSLESADTAGNPVDWFKGRWGTNTVEFSYPVTGSGEGKAARVTMHSRTSGDAKWYFKEVSVTPGKTYRFKNSYKATVPTFVTVSYRLSNGTFVHKDIGTPAAKTDWAPFEATFVVPSNTVSLTVFHLINRIGTLDIDAYTLEEVTTIPPPPDPDNLILNAGLESTDSGGNPVDWFKGRWGTHTAEFVYPVTGNGGGKAAEVSISNRQTGDAKWYFKRVAGIAGTRYTFAHEYKANIPSMVTLEINYTDGTTTYQDIATLPAASTWTRTTQTFTLPAGASSLTIFHLIRQNGTLTVDNYSLKRETGGGSTFSEGMVSLAFDDGWKSVYQNARPILNTAGLKSSLYIITTRFDFPDYMNREEALIMYGEGHEIGSHTRTHQPLTSLSVEQSKDEIEGSLADLENLGITDVSTLAYPLGAYNDTIISQVQNAGYTAARSTDTGFNLKTEVGKYALKRHPVNVATSFEQVKGWIDQARQNKTWLILVFHRVDREGLYYSTTPETLQQIVNYLKNNNVKVVTVKQGEAILQQ